MQSERLAALVGPVLAAITITESPFVNPTLYDSQIPTVVYLNGTLLLIAGIAITRAHNVWRADWRVLLTLIGWVAIAVGLIRMTFPEAHVASVDPNSVPIVALEAVLVALGLFLTYKGYWSRSGE